MNPLHLILGALLTVSLPWGMGCSESIHSRALLLPQTAAVSPNYGMLEARSSDQPNLYNRGENLIRFAAARSEVVAFRYLLSAEQGRAAGLTLTVDDLVGPEGRIHRDVVRMYRQWPVTVSRYPNWYLIGYGLRRPRQIPDVLVPIDAPRHGQPFTLAPGESMSIWVEIRVPATATPGRYSSGLIIRDARGRQSRTPVELEVSSLTLQPNAAMTVLAEVQIQPLLRSNVQAGRPHHNVQAKRPHHNEPASSLNSSRLFNDEATRLALRRAFTVLHEHGLSPYARDLLPDFSQNSDGTVEIDWPGYDAVFGPLLDGTAFEDGKAASAWPLPVDLLHPDPARYGGTETTLYAAVLRSYLTAVHEHFDEKGWLDRAFMSFDLPRGSGASADELALIRRLSGIGHLAAHETPFVSRLIPQSMAPFGWTGHQHEDLSRLVDIWATPAQFQHPATMERARALGKRTWLLPDRPPFSASLAVEAPTIHPRSLPWQAFLQGHDAILIPTTTAWPEHSLNDPIDQADESSESWLVYPGEEFGLDGPLPSVRLKQLQQGIQDAQYLRQLDALGHGATARLAAQSLIKAWGTDAYGDNFQDGLAGRRVEDPGMWEVARQLLSTELLAASRGAAAAAVDDVATRSAWRQFLNGTRQITIRPEYVKLSIDRRPKKKGYLVTFGVGICNDMRLSLAGTLSFGPLPEQWERVSDTIRLEQLREAEWVRERIVASTPTVPRCDLDGHGFQSIILDCGPSGGLETTAVVSVVRVIPSSRAIRVDGNLDDWPPGESNLAADFRRINSFESAHPSRAAAASQTVVYFCRDEERLYIGLRAQMPESAANGEQGPFGNVVRYEDLRPVGEDLVEILLDPTNAATLPDDLYHIVLKASGQAVLERGIGVTPPIGACVPWTGPSWAIEKGPGRWSAEVAIPLATFGDEGRKNRIWGVNIARLEPILGEYSDWSGAPRHVYDPRSLGNLVWPE